MTLLNKTHDELFRKIVEKKSIVCVMGLGQVGIPTMLSFLKIGYRVSGYDVDSQLVEELMKGECRIPEFGRSTLISDYVKSGMLTLSIEKNILLDADVIVICVPTPLNENGTKANLSFLQGAIELVGSSLTTKKLVIVESTIPPRTMEDTVIPLIQVVSGKRVGEDFLISFCPERIAPGNALKELTDNARIIGANDESSYHASYLLYRNIGSGGIYRADTTTAEVSKLAENAFRDVNIAFANELAIICEQYGTDVMDVIGLANTHPRVHIHKPGPGVGGPCLPKDPYLLTMGTDVKQSIVKLARLVNDSMSEHIVKTILNATSNSKSNYEKMNILVLGTSYKPEVADTRHSPSRRITSLLLENGFKRVAVHDPFAKESFGTQLVKDLCSALSAADCVVICTGHSVYASLKVSDFKPGSIVIDTVRILKKKAFSDKTVTYIALGTGFH